MVISEKEAVALLKKYAKGKRDLGIVLRHSRAVQRIALEIGRRVNRAGLSKAGHRQPLGGEVRKRTTNASRPLSRSPCKKPVDLNFLRVAAILHDIGRFDWPPKTCSIRHGVRGEEILLAEGLGSRYARVCSCHLGAGLTKQDVLRQKLPIPAKDYMPKTIEEKIICYADRRVRLTRPIRIETEIKRFEPYGSEAVARLKKLHNDILALQGRAK